LSEFVLEQNSQSDISDHTGLTSLKMYKRPISQTNTTVDNTVKQNI